MEDLLEAPVCQFRIGDGGFPFQPVVQRHPTEVAPLRCADVVIQNAIHGVVLVGAILVTGKATDNVQLYLGLVAIVLASINMVGGFVVTDRMLEMFKPKKAEKKEVSK